MIALIANYLSLKAVLPAAQIALGLMMLMVFSDTASSSTFAVETWRGHRVIRMSGPIDVGTAERFRKATTKVASLPHGLPVILLDSPGGSVSEALEISRIMDLQPFHTVVPDDARCASACASIIFIAGRLRTVEDFGLLGQHSCSRGGAPDATCNEMLGRHALEHGVSTGSVSAFVTYVAPSDILWFTREDADGWGLTKYPGEDLSGFEKSEPRVIKMLTGEMPQAQSAWRINFRGDGYQAFIRPASDAEDEMQINLFCDESRRGRLFLGMQVNGPFDAVADAVISARIKTENTSWNDSSPTVWQKAEGLSEIVTEIPPSKIKALLAKSDQLQFVVALKEPYQPMIAETWLARSRRVLLFAANHCVGGR